MDDSYRAGGVVVELAVHFRIGSAAELGVAGRGLYGPRFGDVSAGPSLRVKLAGPS